MPEPTLRVRRSARRLPVKTLRETMWRYSSFFRNCSSNSFDRSAARAEPSVAACFFPREARCRSAATLQDLAGVLEDLGDDAVGADALGLALEVHDQAVAQRRRGDRADVVDRDG